ncbi:hypothetical protein FB45DRAFT_180487 [Roridomyces roridus]|uniref:Secreted protein n=1 Tax=Roridomyces roridus TaxID=1738132 RepID=A0AAD7CEE7_9AGAR|nr:hypothetical protein FB45DRAFT_180487 [Roridomyces roridus]
MQLVFLPFAFAWSLTRRGALSARVICTFTQGIPLDRIRDQPASSRRLGQLGVMLSTLEGQEASTSTPAPGKARGVCADAFIQGRTVLVPDVEAYARVPGTLCAMATPRARWCARSSAISCAWCSGFGLKVSARMTRCASQSFQARLG